jgi:hypothetical protein
MLRIPCGSPIRIVTGVETPIAVRVEGRSIAGVADKTKSPMAASATMRMRKKINDRTTW